MQVWKKFDENVHTRVCDVIAHKVCEYSTKCVSGESNLQINNYLYTGQLHLQAILRTWSEEIAHFIDRS